METVKLYYENPYERKFEATIIEIKEKDNLLEIILDRTLFYPIGGGQPSDKGRIMGYEVLDVRSDNGIISHFLKEFNCFKVGDKVFGEIDWNTRYEHMQCHTAEHLITGVARKLYGCDNVGFNISENLITIDLNVDLTSEQVFELELLVNEQVLTNTNIDISYPMAKELKELDYRSKLDLVDNVRIVTLDNIDICACCGLHCNTTLEIGIIKFISWKRYKGGVRLMCLAGKRALKDYIKKHKYIVELTEKLSAKEEELVERVEKLAIEVKDYKFKEKEARGEILKLKLKEWDSDIFYEDNIDFNDLKTIANLLQDKFKVVYTLSKNDNDIKYLIASKDEDVRDKNKALCEKFNGKGGGRESMVQGTLQGDFEKIVDYLKEFSKK